MSTAHIMVIEDEEKIAQLLVDYLERDSFRVSVLHSGEKANEEIARQMPDLVLLDLMLPGKDGLTICRELRQTSNIPVIMLTARVDEIDRLLGLELGADDYVCKPFSPREVVARVRVVLRRISNIAEASESDLIRYEGISLSSQRYECLVHNAPVELTPVEFRMLEGLLTHPGRVYSRDQLMDLSYQDDRVVSDRTIDTHVKNLRRKLARAGARDDLIHSIYGVGYKID